MSHDATATRPMQTRLRLLPQSVEGVAESPSSAANRPVERIALTEAMRAAERFSLAERRLEGDEPLLEPAGNRSLAYRTVKRSLDMVGSLVAILLLSPILLTVFLVLCVTTRGKPLIRQQRIGYRGLRFSMYKFRSMRLDAEQLQHLVRNEHQNGPIFKNRLDPRITRIGRIIRRTSIDELPQLFNVLLGDMSLVGPRPPLAREVARYKAWHRRRLAVVPGLTCLWQVSGARKSASTNGCEWTSGTRRTRACGPTWACCCARRSACSVAGEPIEANGPFTT